MATYLYHFSEDPTIEVFEPRLAPTQIVKDAYVWACHDVLAPSYWFPRQCPRGTWWDTERTWRVHAIQWDWYERFLAAEIYAYKFDAAPFRPNERGGGWVTTETVEPLDVQRVGSVLDRHRDAGIELRVVPDLWTLWLAVIEMPGVDFSGIRLANLPQHPDHAVRGQV